MSVLNLNKLYEQIAALGSYQRNRAQSLASALHAAEDQVGLASADVVAFKRKIENAKTSWLVAELTDENPFEVHSPLPRPETYTVLSTDGSQISPDRHGPTPAFLINIGSVEIGYGGFHGYRLDSEPTLFFEEKDTIRRFGGKERDVSGPVLAALRQKMEVEVLGDMISSCENKPAVALVDGTLILWMLETDPKSITSLGTADLKQQSFLAFMQLINTACDSALPVAGYISLPGSADVINALKVHICPIEPVNCDRCPYKGSVLDEYPPCDKINGITDAALFRRLLKPGERSSLFGSISDILQAYGDQRVYFFYVNVGKEIARVEVPGWVAHDKDALMLVHSVCLDQAEKGMGYPIAVAEAHEQAVVKTTDKASFERLVMRALIKQGTSAAESRKAIRKKGGFI
ncbi:MAG TPA: DNA double-strand break repair nuclease NurA [Candidatus Aquicultor sp.]|jgi:hypothetical protein